MGNDGETTSNERSKSTPQKCTDHSSQQAAASAHPTPRHQYAKKNKNPENLFYF
jgi:hypothetical protein